MAVQTDRIQDLASLGLTRTLRIKLSWHAVSILWLAVVVESGSLKSPAFSIASKPLRERRAHERRRIASEAFESDLVLHEIAVTEWKRSKTGGAPPERPEALIAERYTTSNTTIEALASGTRSASRSTLKSTASIPMPFWANSTGINGTSWRSRGRDRVTRLSDLVNDAYGLTPEEVQLLWETAPPRMPFAPLRMR